MKSKREEFAAKIREIVGQDVAQEMIGLLLDVMAVTDPELEREPKLSPMEQVVAEAIALRDANRANEETKRRMLQEVLREAGIIEEVEPAMARLENENEHQRNENIEFRRQITRVLGVPGGTDLVHAVGLRCEQLRAARLMLSEVRTAFGTKEPDLGAAARHVVAHGSVVSRVVQRAHAELQKKIDAKDTENTLRAQRDLARAELKEVSGKHKAEIDEIRRALRTEESDLAEAARRLSRQSMKIVSIRKALGMTWGDHGVVKKIEEIIEDDDQPGLIEEIRKLLCTTHVGSIVMDLKNILSRQEKLIDDRTEALEVRDELREELEEARDAVRIIPGAELVPYLEKMTEALRRVRAERDRLYAQTLDVTLNHAKAIVEERNTLRVQISNVRSALRLRPGLEPEEVVDAAKRMRDQVDGVLRAMDAD